MKISQAFLAETFPDAFMMYLAQVYNGTEPIDDVNGIELNRYYVIEYVSRSHENPFPLIYPIRIEPGHIFAISILELTPERIPALVAYLSEKDELNQDEVDAISPWVRHYKTEQIIKISKVDSSRVEWIAAIYFRMINELLNNEAINPEA